MNDQSRLIAEGIINNGYFVSPISPEEYASISTTSHKHFFFSFRFFFVRQRCGSSLQYVSSSVKTSYEYLREGESVMCRTRVALQREREREITTLSMPSSQSSTSVRRLAVSSRRKHSIIVLHFVSYSIYRMEMRFFKHLVPYESYTSVQISLRF